MDSRHPYLSPNKNTRAVRVVDGHQATNTKLLTNPIPVNNSGLLLPSTRIRLSVGREYLQNVALYPNPIPINASWNLLGPNTRVRVTASDTSDPSEMWLFPPIGSTVNWGRQFDVPLVGGAATLNNLALNSVAAAPFFTQDFAKAFRPSAAVGQDAPNLAIKTSVAATAPFYTQDFAKAFFPAAAKTDAQYYSLNIATLPPPDLTTNLRSPVVAKPFALLPNRGDQVGINLALLTAVAPVQLPFNQYIWTPTQTAPSAPAVTFNTTYTLPAPFVPYDTSYARINPDWLPAPLYPNVALLNSTQPVAAPFYQTDFSPASRVRKSLAQDVQNFALLNSAQVVTAPFYQTDFSPAARVKNFNLAIAVPNVPLLAALSTPFAQTDWPAQRRVRASQFAHPNGFQYPNSYTLNVTAGSYTISGNDVALTYTQVNTLNVSAGAYTITGYPVTLTYRPNPAPPVDNGGVGYVTGITNHEGAVRKIRERNKRAAYVGPAEKFNKGTFQSVEEHLAEEAKPQAEPETKAEPKAAFVGELSNLGPVEASAIPAQTPQEIKAAAAALQRIQDEQDIIIALLLLS